MVQCPRTKQTQPGTAQDPPSAVEIHKSHTRDYRARLSAGDFPHNSITKSHQKLPHSHDTYDVHQAIIRDDDEWGQVCGETGIFVSHCRCSHFRRVWHFLLVHTIRCAPATPRIPPQRNEIHTHKDVHGNIRRSVIRNSSTPKTTRSP